MSPQPDATTVVEPTPDEVTGAVVTLVRALARTQPPFGAEPWVKLGKAAEHADCSPDALARAIKAGRLFAGKVGADYRVRLSDVDVWVRAEAERARPRPEPAECKDDLGPATRRILDSLKGGKG